MANSPQKVAWRSAICEEHSRFWVLEVCEKRLKFRREKMKMICSFALLVMTGREPRDKEVDKLWWRSRRRTWWSQVVSQRYPKPQFTIFGCRIAENHGSKDLKTCSSVHWCTRRWSGLQVAAQHKETIYTGDLWLRSCSSLISHPHACKWDQFLLLLNTTCEKHDLKKMRPLINNHISPHFSSSTSNVGLNVAPQLNMNVSLRLSRNYCEYKWPCPQNS
jgi:hypothetical protein